MIQVQQRPVEQDPARIADAVRDILVGIGENPERQGLLETPDRVARADGEICRGVGQDPADEIDVVFDEGYKGLVLVRDIPFYSLCEHHLLPFMGHAHVAYLPSGGRITGLSKLARAVDLAARRPQVQERLTEQVADAVARKLEPLGVLVLCEAEHLCMTMRGVQKPGSITATSCMRGCFLNDPALRAEALSLIRPR